MKAISIITYLQFSWQFSELQPVLSNYSKKFDPLKQQLIVEKYYLFFVL